jgi:phosphomannomutase
MSNGRKYFGTDGVRGTVGEAPITPEFVLRLVRLPGARWCVRQISLATSAPRC